MELKSTGIKISIIVPVYGVEKYISDCIASLCNQTYENIEILLVDDGSVDGSGRICDAWAEKDSRIMVFHIPNGGQSRARNVGLSHATGAYIGFVDGDDCAEPKMYETLFQQALAHDAEIVECNFSGRKSPEPDQMEEGALLQLSGREAIENQIDIRVGKRYPSTSVWSKLFKADLIADLRFPEGKIHEEYGFLCKAFYDCKTYVYCNQRLYKRTLRGDSTTAMKFSVRMLDKLEVFRDRNRFLQEAGDEKLYRLSKENEYVTMLHFFGEACKSELTDLKKQLKEELMLQKKDVLASNLPASRKLKFYLFYLSPGLYERMMHR